MQRDRRRRRGRRRDGLLLVVGAHTRRRQRRTGAVAVRVVRRGDRARRSGGSVPGHAARVHPDHAGVRGRPRRHDDRDVARRGPARELERADPAVGRAGGHRGQARASETPRSSAVRACSRSRIPTSSAARATFRGTLYDGFPGWARTMTLPDDEKLVALQDPDTRARLFAASQSEEAGLMRATLGDWGGVVARRHADRSLPPLRRARRSPRSPTAFGTTPFEALLDAVVADRLATSIIPVPPGDDPESWAFRERTWHDPRVVLGASDAGAHVDMIWTYDWACAFLVARARTRRDADRSRRAPRERRARRALRTRRPRARHGRRARRPRAVRRRRRSGPGSPSGATTCPAARAASPAPPPASSRCS